MNIDATFDCSKKT